MPGVKSEIATVSCSALPENGGGGRGREGVIKGGRTGREAERNLVADAGEKTNKKYLGLEKQREVTDEGLL